MLRFGRLKQAGTDNFTVVYSVDQTVTEGETSIGYTSAYMVVVHVDGDGNMVITQNPTISSIPTKSGYEPKVKGIGRNGGRCHYGGSDRVLGNILQAVPYRNRKRACLLCIGEACLNL